MKLSKCTQCGAALKNYVNGKAVCEYCGSTFYDDSFRSEDGAIKKSINELKELFSTQQKNKTQETAATTSTQQKGYKNKYISILLCLFFGWIGAHRFYEGKFVSAIVYMFSYGLFFVGIIIDLIILLQKPQVYKP